MSPGNSRVDVLVIFGIVNACSVCNKTDIFTDYVTDVNIDLVANTKIWLGTGEKDNKPIKDLTLTDYNIRCVPTISLYIFLGKIAPVL